MELAEILKDLRNVVAMVGQVPGVNKDVVDIHNHKSVEELPEHLIHELLEDGWHGHTVLQDIHSGQKE